MLPNFQAWYIPQMHIYKVWASGTEDILFEKSKISLCLPYELSS